LSIEILEGKLSYHKQSKQHPALLKGLDFVCIYIGLMPIFLNNYIENV